MASRPARTTRSLLIVDCGSVFTKVALLGLVEEHYRLLARAEVASTIAPPTADVVVGVREAVAQLEHTTGRTLLRDGTLLTPERDDGEGVDGLALAASAGGPLRLLATGPGRDALAGLLHRSIGGLFVQLSALPSAPSDDAEHPEWLQTVAQVRALHPHAVLVMGSSFGAGHGQGSIEETAAAVTRWLDMLAAGDVDRNEAAGVRLPLVFSGSAEDAGALESAVRGHTSAMQPVEALSPSTLAPLNRAVSALYETAVLREIPGYTGLRQLSSVAPAATVTATAGMVRFLAQHFQTNVVGVDVGASATKLVGATPQGEFLPAVHPSVGVGLGAGAILRAGGIANVLRWLSAPATEDELREYVLMRMLRPRALPTTVRELEFEHALAREAITLALRAPGSRLAGLQPMDVILGTGGVLAHVPTPAHAALILLDALQPQGITSLVLDTAQLSGALGSVAGIDATAAAEVAQGDAVLLQLGTVIATTGAAPEGQPALRVVLEFADGRRHVEDVTPGTLVRLPVQPGEQTTLGLYPAAGVDVGLGPGQQARAAEPVEGGALGLLVDARGRHLTLPAAADERMALMKQWRRALGVEG